MPIDVTEMTDNAFDVFMAVKAGDLCVTVDHLSPEERFSVCQALGVDAKTHWLTSAPYVAPVLKAPVHYTDVEARILDRQDDEI